ELGYLKAPEGTLGRMDELRNLSHNKVVIVTTGSQGEPTSGLVRIANRDHRQIHQVLPGGRQRRLCQSGYSLAAH
ncbi:unnamed protein product, partial [marine sediment metagenome]